jgi:protein KRI1
MKALKMREIKRKLDMVRREGGLEKKIGHGHDDDDDDDEFVDETLDLDGEWDAEKHDRQMAGLFNQDAEVAAEGDDAWAEEFVDDAVLDEDGKPKWGDDIDIGDIALPDDDAFHHGDSRKSKKDKKKKKKKKNDDEDEGAVDVDAMDADAQLEQDDEEWDGTEEMRKRKLNEYMDEVYGLDFNDIVSFSSFLFSLARADIFKYFFSKGWRPLHSI